MNAPSNANTSGLEDAHEAVSVLRAFPSNQGEVVGHITAKGARMIESCLVDIEDALVTAASAQAKIAELEARNLDLSMLAYGWMEAHDLLASGKPYLFPSPADVPESIARATAAEARADRLAKAIYDIENVADSFCDDSADLLAGQIRIRTRAALQQETQT